MIAWTLFLNPVELSHTSQLWLILPLFFSVAIVHKTMRCTDLRRLPREALGAVIYMAMGLAIAAGVLWAITSIWIRMG
jgi:hypothetical protein